VDVLREWVVVVALVVTAMAIPLVWNHVDTTRRMNLKQTAYAGCLTHHDLAGCAAMGPVEVDPATVALCEMRFDPRDCAQLRVSPDSE
jgi:hypothetical protein